MKGIVPLMVATLAAIGVGVAVEGTQQFGPPNAVLAAIGRTMGATSLRVVLEPSRRPSGFRPSPAIYNAPDRYASSGVLVVRGGSLFPTIFIGDNEYVADPVKMATPADVVEYLELPVTGPKPDGLNVEQLRAFSNMQGLRDGSDFQKIATGYTFRLFVEETIQPRLSTIKPIEFKLTGGVVVLQDGYVRQLTINEVTDGRVAGSTVTYSDFNRAPTIHRPTRVEPCSSYSRHTSEGQICRALGSAQR
jgi:hypothetical protein